MSENTKPVEEIKVSLEDVENHYKEYGELVAKNQTVQRIIQEGADLSKFEFVKRDGKLFLCLEFEIATSNPRLVQQIQASKK